MENESKVQELSPEQEIAQAQAALQKAKERVAEAQKLKVAKAAADLKECKQKKEEKILLRKLEYEAIQKKWAEKKHQEEEERLAEQRRVQAEQIELENRLNREQEELRKSQEHEKEVRRLSDEAFRLEQQAKQEEADALRASAPFVAEEVITIHSQSHPLSKILGVTNPTVAPEPEFVPAAEFVPAPTLRKIDQSEVDLVAGVWLSKLSTRPTGQQAIPLLQRFNPQDIGAAIDLVSKDKRFSERDTHYRAISEVLWGRSLDTLASTLNNEAEQLRADREARNASR